jgi:diketogulonate reductase-like aldo/keto reductase
LEIALTNGYIHIDCVECYGDIDYREIIKNKIKIIPIEELWIT